MQDNSRQRQHDGTADSDEQYAQTETQTEATINVSKYVGIHNQWNSHESAVVNDVVNCVDEPLDLSTNVSKQLLGLPQLAPKIEVDESMDESCSRSIDIESQPSMSSRGTMRLDQLAHSTQFLARAHPNFCLRDLDVASQVEKRALPIQGRLVNPVCDDGHRSRQTHRGCDPGNRSDRAGPNATVSRIASVQTHEFEMHEN